MTSERVIRLIVNGKSQEYTGPRDLPSFLKSIGIENRFIAVAHNGQVLRKEEFGGVTLQDRDVLEIVRPVGGG